MEVAGPLGTPLGLATPSWWSMAGTLWAQLPTWCSPVGPCVGLILWFGAFPGAFGLGRAQPQRRGTMDYFYVETSLCNLCGFNIFGARVVF